MEYAQGKAADIKKIGDVQLLLVTATSVETEAVHSLMEPLSDEELVLRLPSGANTYYLGKFGAFHAVHVQCEMGSVGRASSTVVVADALKLWKARAVVMLGICFGRDKSTQSLGDIMVSRVIIPYETQRVGKEMVVARGPRPEADTTLINRFSSETKWVSEKQKEEIRVRKATMLSGEKLVDNAEFKKQLFDMFPDAVCGEMEGAGVYAACTADEYTPWIIVKSICDWGEGKEKGFQSVAASNAAGYARHVLSNAGAFDGKFSAPSALLHFGDLRGEDVVKISYPKQKIYEARKVSEPRYGISYEYVSVEVAKGITIGHLFVNKGIKVEQTLRDFVTRVTSQPSVLKICSPRIKRADNAKLVDRLKTIRDVYHKITQEGKWSAPAEYFWLDDFLWDFCLGNQVDSLQGGIDRDKFFVDQELFVLSHDGKLAEQLPSLKYMKMILESESTDHPVTVVLGKAGVGKTTFCEEAVGLINGYAKRRAVYISATDLRGAEADVEIGSVSELYRYYTTTTGFSRDSILDPNNLEINVSCGNLVLVIDGLDEIEAMLGERFNLDTFLASAVQLNDSLKNCNILITSRDYHAQKYSRLSDANTLYLIGFSSAAVEGYFEKRFPNDSQKRKRARKLLDELALESNGRHTPLFLSLICDILEREEWGQSQEHAKSNYFGEKFPLDRLIFELFKREIGKQSLKAGVDDLFDLLAEVAVKNNGEIAVEALNEYIESMFPADINSQDGRKALTRFYVNPLLLPDQSKDRYRIRHDQVFLWVRSRFLSYAYLNGTSFDDLERLLAEGYNGASELVSDAVTLLKEQERAVLTSCTRTCIEKLTRRYIDAKSMGEMRVLTVSRKAIAGMLHIHFRVLDIRDKTERTDELVRLYGGKTLRGLCLFGPFPSLDFRDVEVRKGYFEEYSGLEHSNFPEQRTVFFDTSFKRTPVHGSFNAATVFDVSCDLDDDLKGGLARGSDDANALFENLREDVKRSLRVGFHQGKFVWKSEHVYSIGKQSLHTQMAFDKFLALLVRYGVLDKLREKAGKGYGYEVQADMRAEAKALVAENMLKPKLEAVLRAMLKELAAK